jgi:hypothetical protein
MYVIGDSHWEEKQMNQVTENLCRTQKHRLQGIQELRRKKKETILPYSTDREYDKLGNRQIRE